MGTGKKKIEIKRKETIMDRKVTFTKRRQGLFKKAHDLHSLYGAQTAILAFSPAGQAYVHGDPSFDDTVDRFLNDDTSFPQTSFEDLQSWVDSIQVNSYDDLDETLGLKRDLEDIRDQVLQKADDNFIYSLLA